MSTTPLHLVGGHGPAPKPEPPGDFSDEYTTRAVSSTYYFGHMEDGAGTYRPRDLKGELEVSSLDPSTAWIRVRYTTVREVNGLEDYAPAGFELPLEAIEPLGRVILRLARNAERDGLFEVTPRPPKEQVEE